MGSSKTVLIDQIEQLTAPVLAEHAVELVDLQFVHEHGQWILRYFLDKEGGVTLDDCATVSEHLGRTLDAADVIPQRYSLEVSSPGIDRPLKKESDYRRFIGQRADVTLFAPLDGRRHFRGLIESVEPGQVTLRDSEQAVFALSLANVAKAKLDPDIHF